MIKPVLKNLHISFVQKPIDINNFVIGVDVNIFTEDDEGADIFYCRVMTPQKLNEILLEDGVVSGRGIFIVHEQDMESNLKLVEQKINKFLKECARETWEEVALAINYYLDWEYYDPSCGVADFYKSTRKLELCSTCNGSGFLPKVE
ncbi:immunity 8 family protein [Paenibacillus thiaminolyticus]|nr:immunity 8 family protein [Paenibacillus thiaminolyticus]